MPPPSLTAASLVPHVRRCRYTDALLAKNYDFGHGTVPLAGFADTPHDARSICIAAIDTNSDPSDAVANLKPLGAPVIFACHSGSMQWWKQTTGSPEILEVVNANQLRGFFDKHARDFAPATIFEGKTRRRLPGQAQLTFVDAGLMPMVERESGAALSSLVERVIRGMEKSLGRTIKTGAEVDAVYKSTFWLLAAKVLREKRVQNFITIKLDDIDDVFRRVGLHYGDTNGLPPGGKSWRAAITEAADTIDGFPRLAHVSTDALAHVYENAMIPPDVRKANGTHSTPGALVDYMVWQLWPWIEALPVDRRHVFEPACGHGAFLVGALRVLRQWSGIDDEKARHEYLRKHLHGIEYDSFAWEVARLRLALADMPHGNSWDLTNADMLAGSKLETEARRCGVLLANPPYERFTKEERSAYAKARITLRANTKACEMLRRTIPHLARGACFGVVVPLGFLHSKEATELRRGVLADFELAEIAVFEDKLFEKSEPETAVLLGRRKPGKAASGGLWYRRVRNIGVEAFRNRFAFSSEERVQTSRFKCGESASLFVPELDSVWRYLAEGSTLGTIATIGQGLFHKGESLPKGAWTIRDPAHSQDTLGYANVPDDLDIFGLPKPVGINLSEAAIDRIVAGAPIGKPQVLVNYSPVSREAWRLKATLDEKGLALTSRFIAVRPIHSSETALYLWAMLNSPLANAFVFCHLGKRDILVGTLRKMPIPSWSPEHAARIEQAAMRYRTLAASFAPLYEPHVTPDSIKRALLDMDAAVLRAFDLPPRLERELLNLFQGVERKGVGCKFDGYFPPDFRPCVPLHEYISEKYRRSTAGELAKGFRPVRSKAAIAALDLAEELAAGE